MQTSCILYLSHSFRKKILVVTVATTSNPNKRQRSRIGIFDGEDCVILNEILRFKQEFSSVAQLSIQQVKPPKISASALEEHANDCGK